MQYIKKYNTKKVKDYIKSGQRVLIEYKCGLGDVIMFLPYYKRFCELYPEVKIDIRTKNQDCFFNEYSKDYSVYDYVFKLRAWFNEKLPELNKYTKPECNCIIELGIPYKKELEYTYKLPFTKNEKYKNYVGCAFYNSCFPKYNNCSYYTAKIIWEKIKENGMTPIELYHPTDFKSYSMKFDFIDLDIRKDNSGLVNAINMMASLKGMCSVSTGNFHFGMTVYPEKILYLQKDFSYKFYTNKDVLSINVNKPDMGVINEWIGRLK